MTRLSANQIKVLEAAAKRCATDVQMKTKRARTRAINDVSAAGLIYDCYSGNPRRLTPAGVSALEACR